jgi:hypothetical protein
MLRDMIPRHRPATPLSRATAALPDLHHMHVHVPHPHLHRRQRRFGTTTMMRAVAGLVAVLVGTGGVILREKLAAMFRRRGGGSGEQVVADSGAKE